jgi:hypothetical protein
MIVVVLDVGVGLVEHPVETRQIAMARSMGKKIEFIFFIFENSPSAKEPRFP